jgi:hypothetical protein
MFHFAVFDAPVLDFSHIGQTLEVRRNLSIAYGYVSLP